MQSENYATLGDLLSSVRFALQDPHPGQRWTDRRLVNLLDSVLATLSLQLDFFVDFGVLTIPDNGVRGIDISDKAVKILRIDYNGKNLPFKSMEDLDAENPNWQEVQSDDIKYAVVNRQNIGKVLFYPALNYDDVTVPCYGIITDMRPLYDRVHLPENDDNFVISRDRIQENAIIVRYIKRQPAFIKKSIWEMADGPDSTMIELDTTTAEGRDTSLEINFDLMHCIEHYIIGQAYRDNQDAENQQKGATELELYAAKLQQFIENKAMHHTDLRPEVRYSPIE